MERAVHRLTRAITLAVLVACGCAQSRSIGVHKDGSCIYPDWNDPRYKPRYEEPKPVSPVSSQSAANKKEANTHFLSEDELIQAARDYLCQQGYTFDEASGRIREPAPGDSFESAWVVQFRASRHGFVVYMAEDGTVIGIVWLQ